jgi:hypothetical protein
MSQNLSFSSIAATLAVLSASGLVGCAGNATPPAQSPDAKEVPAATTSSTTAAVDSGPMKDGVAPSEGASGSSPAPATAAEAPKAAADSAAPAPAAAASTAAPTKDDKPKATGKKKAAGAKAGCGAGTCG